MILVGYADLEKTRERGKQITAIWETTIHSIFLSHPVFCANRQWNDL